MNGSIPVLPGADFNPLLSYVGNHEGKTAVTAIILSQPTTDFRDSSLRYAVSEAQGNNSGWVPGKKSCISYCELSIEPSGAIMHNGKAYQAVEPLLAQRLAFCGDILGWSLDYPEFSVQRLLGTTATIGAYRSPELKYKICKMALASTQAERELSFADIYQQFGVEETNDRTVRNSIDTLAKQGILEVHTYNATEDCRLQILDPTFHRGPVAFEDLKPTTRSMYTAFGMLWKQGKRVISFEELYAQIQLAELEVDLAELRVRWQVATTETATNFPGMRGVERTIKDPSKLSTVRLHADRRESVGALVERLEGLQVDPEHAYHAW